MSKVFPRKFAVLLAALGAVAALVPSLAGAQAVPAPAAGASKEEIFCGRPPMEAIVTLPLPQLGIPPAWQGFYAPGLSAQMLGGRAAGEDTDAMMTVSRLLTAQGAEGGLSFATLNSRGRVTHEKKHPAFAGETPVAVEPLGAGYAVLGNLAASKDRKARVRIAWYDRNGTRRNEKILTGDHGANLTGHALVSGPEGKSLLVAAEAIIPGKQEGEEEQYSLLYHFSDDGKLVWSRSYKPGLPSRLYGAMPLEDGGWLAMGDIRMLDGRWAGMAMRLRTDGTMIWQQSYPRGRAAALRHAQAGKAAGDVTFYYVLGEASPAGEEPQAGWLLALDENGTSVGQRYFRREDTVYDALALERYENGRHLIALNAMPRDGSRQPPHVRLLTLSPRADILGDESYVEGVGVRGAALVSGGGGHALLATISTEGAPLDIEMSGKTFLIHEPLPPLVKDKPGDDKDGKSSKGSASRSDEDQKAAENAAIKAAEAEKRTAASVTTASAMPAQKGWVVKLPPAAPYNDPCAAAP